MQERWVSLALFLVIAHVVRAEVQVVVEPASGSLVPSQSVQTPRAKADSGPSNALWVPFFEVDGKNPAGVTTLFAVHNRATSSVNVRYEYYSPCTNSCATVVTQYGTLAPHQTKTVNIRDIVGIPADPVTGFKTGWVRIFNWGYTGGLMGDYFRVDPTNNFASGDSLVNDGALCYHWDSRFMNGGAFTGGTTFTFWLEANDSGGTTPIVAGQVYDEAGTHRGTVQIYTADGAFEINTSELPAAILGTFGNIEWTVQNGFKSFVLATYRASGKYSIGLPSMCVD